MQAITASSQASPEAVAHDLYALIIHLLRTSTHDVFRALGDLDLSISQVKMLHILDAEGELPLKDLGERLTLSLAASSRAVEGLHQRAFVTRRADEHDRRMKRVALTAAGRDVVTRLSEARLAVLQRFAETMTGDERRQMIDALAPLMERVEISTCRPDGNGR